MSLRSAILSNMQLKLLSLLFAAVLWLFVFMESIGEGMVSLGIKPVNVPSGLLFRQEQLPQVRIKVAGPRILIVRQQLVGAYAELDFAGTAAGSVAFNAIERRVKLLPGLRITDIVPSGLNAVLMDSKAADKIK